MAEQQKPAGATPAADPAADPGDAGTGEATGEPVAAEEGDGGPAGDGKMELAQPKKVELDMSALGQVNPEQDLADGGILDEQSAAGKTQEEWTERGLDILEIHGYFRVRPELYHNFAIRGDNAVYDRTMEWKVNQQTDQDGYLGEDCRDGSTRKSCNQSTLAGANMRLRLEPTLNVSEEVRVKAQIDFLDNVMLGSTPRYWQDYGALPGEDVQTGRVYGWDMGPPGSSDMIVVRRAWGEVMTPIGQLRFGRMGDHWGLGMLHNAGNGLNDDFGDSVDRITFAAKINDWLIAPAFDFPNEGMSSVDASGRPFDVSQLDDAYQLVAIIAYKHDREEQLAMLKRGDWLINSGLYFAYRWQVLSFENSTTDSGELDTTDTDTEHFFRRDMWTIVPDLWFQLLWDTLHIELEFAFVYGELGNPDRELSDFDQAQALTLLQYGGVLQGDYGLLSDQLRIGLEAGFASGDDGVEGLRAPATFDQINKPTDATYGAFSFHPSYNIDSILYHHILGSVSQSYYFNLWLRYDFLKSTMGRLLGIQVDATYARAVFAKSTINDNSANLGVELDAQAMYVSEDHFYAGLVYGVLFPLGAFEGQPYWPEDSEQATPYVNDRDLSIPQTVQLLLGITF